nr:ribonuclease H-like domain, reverse transcriptase, RNA-dependent DNA polymerase [Tanacetum cinerariifolium]
EADERQVPDEFNGGTHILFWSSRKLASTPIDTEKPLLKDPDGEDVDVHTYSDYAGAILDKKSTTGGCQFLGCRLISWQCKKQAVVATSSIKAEYVAATSSGPTWLFDIDSLTRTMNYQPVTAGNQTNPSAGFQDKFVAKKAGEEIDQQYVLFPVWSFGSTNPQNNDEDDTFDVKEHDFDAKKPESEVSVSPSSSAQSRKHDDKTKKKAKGKSHVESFTGYRDLSVEFEDCSDNSINEVNAAGTIVPTVGQNSLNNTNTFSAAGPSNADASPTYGKSSFIDASQLLDDPDMLELEDITYSNNEDDVGAEADFNNLETYIIVSPIPTTRVHKDHPEEPKRVHQALKDPSWIEAMQEELLQFKMQKVCILVDLPHEKRAIGTKWVYRNKKDERGIMVRNKARLVA